MPGISQKGFSEIVGPSIEALKALSACSNAVLKGWRRELRDFGVKPDDLGPLATLDFESMARRLQRMSLKTFEQRMRRLGVELVRRRVSIEHAMAALHLLLKISLQYLLRDHPDTPAPAVALARLHSQSVVLLVSEYANRWVASRKTLQASLTEAEHRLHDASAYVTRVYEGERRRLSQDLHDDIGHDLMLIKLYLEMMTLDIKKHEVPEVEGRLKEALALVAHAIESVRRLVLDLGPAIFDELGFLPAFKSYTRQFSSRTGINVSFREGNVPENIPQSHQVAMYRVLQGALSNVLKHAKAKNVKVSLGSMKDSVLIMVIEDDGVGFDVETTPTRRSFGLTAMRERVEVLGGRFHIHSNYAGSTAKGRGTRIEVDLPLPGVEAK